MLGWAHRWQATTKTFLAVESAAPVGEPPASIPSGRFISRSTMSIGEELPQPQYANLVGAQRDSTNIILMFLFGSRTSHVCVGRMVVSIENADALIRLIEKAKTSTEDPGASRP